MNILAQYSKKRNPVTIIQIFLTESGTIRALFVDSKGKIRCDYVDYFTVKEVKGG